MRRRIGDAHGLRLSRIFFVIENLEFGFQIRRFLIFLVLGRRKREFYQKKEGRERGKVGDSTGKRQFINLLKFYQKKEGRERGRVSDSTGKKAVY